MAYSSVSSTRLSHCTGTLPERIHVPDVLAVSRLVLLVARHAEQRAVADALAEGRRRATPCRLPRHALRAAARAARPDGHHEAPVRTAHPIDVAAALARLRHAVAAEAAAREREARLLPDAARRDAALVCQTCDQHPS
eukprot:4291897-Prymnesium_polylepis.1